MTSTVGLAMCLYIVHLILTFIARTRTRWHGHDV